MADGSDRYAAINWHGETVDVTILVVVEDDWFDWEIASASFHHSEEAEIERFIEKYDAAIL